MNFQGLTRTPILRHRKQKVAYNEPEVNSLRPNRDILSFTSSKKKQEVPQSSTFEMDDSDAHIATSTASAIPEDLHDSKVGSDIATRGAQYLLLFVAFAFLISMGVLKYRAANRSTEAGQTDLEFIIIPAEESDSNEEVYEEDRLLNTNNSSLPDEDTLTVNDLSGAEDDVSEDRQNRENEA